MLLIYNQPLNSSGKILRAAKAGGQGRGMSKETDTDSTSRCVAELGEPNYCNTEQATELKRGSGESSAEKEKTE